MKKLRILVEKTFYDDPEITTSTVSVIDNDGDVIWIRENIEHALNVMSAIDAGHEIVRRRYRQEQ